MIYLIPFISAFLYRLDGVGDGDRFLCFLPWKIRGVNYARYAIGPVIALITHNWFYLVSYTIAVSIPYGEKHSWMKFGLLSWWVMGFIFGLASLNLSVGLWLGFVIAVMKEFDVNQSILEFFGFGFLGTIVFAFN